MYCEAIAISWKRRGKINNPPLPANFGREEMFRVMDSSMKDALMPSAARRGMRRLKANHGPL